MSLNTKNSLQVIGDLESTFLVTLKRVYSALSKEKLIPIDQLPEQFLRQSYMSSITFNGKYQQIGKGFFLFIGSLSLAWDINGYLKMAEAFMDENYTEINEVNKRIGTELLNTIVGNSIKKLTEKGIQLEIAKPIFNIGDNTGKPESLYRNTHNFQTELGDIVFNFSFDQAPLLAD